MPKSSTKQPPEVNLSRDRDRIRNMFSGISRRYDFLNHLLSLNRDRSWRKRTALALEIRKEDRILDACTGTGDLALELSGYVDTESGGHVIGTDFCPEMVAIGERKRLERDEERCSLLVADTLKLPYANETFDAVTVAFGIRNLCDLEAGLRELRRVLKPGGRIALLEFTPPRGAFLRSLFALYLLPLLPWIGRVFSRSSKGAEAYSYLPASVMDFPGPERLEELLRQTGFDSVRHRLMTAGIVALHLGLRGEQPESLPNAGAPAEKCSLVLAPDSTADQDGLSAALQEQLGMHRSDAMARARYGGGILASGEARPRLEQLAAALEKLGASSSIAETAELENLPRPKRITGLQFSTGKLTAASLGGKNTDIEKADLAGIKVYALLPETSPAKEEEEAGGGGLPASLLSGATDDGRITNAGDKLARLLDRLQDPKFNGISFHLTLYGTNPPMALKINKDEFDYSCLEADKTGNSLGNFLLLLERLLDWTPATGNAEEARTFLDAPDPEIILLSGENEAAGFDRSRLWNMKTDNDKQASAKAENPGENETHD
ncbi:MAG: ubiquinone/menaquinone biosynthesis methyltransferase [Planctomycetota bacterium]|nr:ubiquinone/menaquinone biosynthesis methyltransferase [Planctomycetota bacterium]